MINIIVPADLKRSIFWGIKNILRVANFKRQDINIYISLNTRLPILFSIIKIVIERLNNRVKVLECRYSGGVNRSKLRNCALEVVDENILLMDLDLCLPKKEIIDWLNDSKPKFAMFACLYERKDKKKKYFSASIKSMRSVYSHIAIPSSIVFIRKNTLKFDELFIGHGYEDFDFIIRTLLKNRLIAPTSDLLIDQPYESVMQISGLRLVLAEFALETLKEGYIFEHIYHKKGDRKIYKDERMRNFNIYKTKFKHLNAYPSYKKNIFNLIEDKHIKINEFPGAYLLL